MLLDYPPQSALGISLKRPENSLDEATHSKIPSMSELCVV